MIRADLYKGAKRLSNFIDRDASPRKDDQGKSPFSTQYTLSWNFAGRRLYMLRDFRQLTLYGAEVTQPEDHLNLPSQMRVYN